MLTLHIVRPNDEIDVLLMRNKEDSTFSFVNLTKGHICPCKFNTIDEAFIDLENYKKEGKVLSWTVNTY